MLELIVGTYGFACWLVFKKFRLIPINTYSVCTAILGGIVLLVAILISLSICHPVSHDGRLYTPIVQIVPQVKGVVVEVPVTPNEPLKEGDILFRIDPRPYQFEVDRLQAALASKNAQVAQLETQVAAAEAQTRLQRSNLLISESDNDRQARVTLEQATQQISRTSAQLDLAVSQLKRMTELLSSKAVAQSEYDTALARKESLEATLSQAKASEQGAQEKLDSGSDRVQAARELLSQAEAQEREARMAFDAKIDGVNPDVRQIMAQLDQKRWELEQTVVRAPTDGFVTQLALRPGQMSVPMPFAAQVVFVPDERPVLIASFPQNVVMGFEPGQEAELAFKAFPGQTFQAKVKSIFSIIPEGGAAAKGQLRSVSSEFSAGKVPVIFEYDDELLSRKLPVGAQATIAVYTDKLHALSIVRKIILRIKSWENYVLVPVGLGH